MKASKGKVVFFSIITYMIVNIIFNVTYFIAEILVYKLSNITIINYLLAHGFDSASFMLALLLSVGFEIWFIDKVFDSSEEDERRVKFLMSIYFIVANVINLLAVFIAHVEYYPGYGAFFLVGIVMFFRYKKHKNMD